MFSANPYVEPMPGTQAYERERFEPLVVLHESPTSYEIQIDLPDCAAKDVDVRVHPRDIVIRCKHAIDHSSSDARPQFGSFLKRVHLAHAIDRHAVRTVLADGTLEIAAQKLCA
jgi:HSP20 family molecular chaperone IbpA